MKELLAKIMLLPSKVMDMLNGMIDGLIKQVSTTKGSVICLITILVIADIILKGSVGVIGFTVTQTKEILLALSGVLKEGGWQLITALLIVLLFFKKDK